MVELSTEVVEMGHLAEFITIVADERAPKHISRQSVWWGGGSGGLRVPPEASMDWRAEIVYEFRGGWNFVRWRFATRVLTVCHPRHMPSSHTDVIVTPLIVIFA